MLLLSTLDPDTSLLLVSLFAVIFGLGLGFNMQTLVLAIQNSVPPQDMGVATSSATFFRQMGGTLGTAVFLSILFGSVVGNIKDAFAAAAKTPAFQQALADPAVTSNPDNQPVLKLLQGTGTNFSIDDSSFIGKLDPRLARPVLDGFATSMDLVFTIGAGVLAIAFLVSFFLPEEKLRTQSGLQARESQEAASVASDLAAKDLAAKDLAAEDLAAEDLTTADGARPVRNDGPNGSVVPTIG
jgi:hypothetical protein